MAREKKEKEKKDCRRWVIMTLRTNGAAEAQSPLPIGHNTIRVLFERDVPVIVPAFYYEQLKNASLPRFELPTPGSRKQKDGGLRTTNDTPEYRPIGYAADIVEIPMEYQTMEGIERFEDLLVSEETAPVNFEFAVGAKIGVPDISEHSEAWSEAVKAMQKPAAK